MPLTALMALTVGACELDVGIGHPPQNRSDAALGLLESKIRTYTDETGATTESLAIATRQYTAPETSSAVDVSAAIGGLRTWSIQFIGRRPVSARSWAADGVDAEPETGIDFGIEFDVGDVFRTDLGAVSYEVEVLSTEMECPRAAEPIENDCTLLEIRIDDPAPAIEPLFPLLGRIWTHGGSGILRLQPEGGSADWWLFSTEDTDDIGACHPQTCP